MWVVCMYKRLSAGEEILYYLVGPFPSEAAADDFAVAYPRWTPPYGGGCGAKVRRLVQPTQENSMWIVTIGVGPQARPFQFVGPFPSEAAATAFVTTDPVCRQNWTATVQLTAPREKVNDAQAGQPPAQEQAAKEAGEAVSPEDFVSRHVRQDYGSPRAG
jgi:hypothetical protein